MQTSQPYRVDTQPPGCVEATPALGFIHNPSLLIRRKQVFVYLSKFSFYNIKRLWI